MIERQFFGAPWGAKIWAMTALGCGVIVIAGVALATVLLAAGDIVPQAYHYFLYLMLAVVMFVPVGAAIFMVRGYIVEESKLVIRRLGWNSTIPLRDLRQVEYAPGAIAGFPRKVFGNDGMFSMVGWFRNKRLGTFRAYVTKPQNAVVLRFENRTVVVTPDRPEEFVDAVKQAAGLP